MDWSQLSMLMEKYGGVSAFGSWQDWGSPFDLKQLQEKWDGKAFHDVMSALEKHKAQVEKANLQALHDYCLLGQDRRQAMLDRFSKTY